MAVNQPSVFNKSLLAAADLSAKQFFYVGENGSNKYNVTGNDTLGAFGAGFLMNQPEINEACEVATIGGGAKGKLSGTVAVDDKLIAKADGTLIVDPAGVADEEHFIVAIALDGGVTGDVINVQPVLYSRTVHS